MSTLIIDYGMGNLFSVKYAFEKCGANVCISDDPKDIMKSDNLVLPGVGTFKDGMKNLKERGWIPAIKKAISEERLYIPTVKSHLHGQTDPASRLN